MRIRTDTNANYKAVFFNGKTIRQRLNSSMPISAPLFAEIEDVAINDKCFANCFIPGSKIRTNLGLKNIETIVKGDSVISYNELDNKFEEKEVYELFENEYDGELICLELDNGSKISCTPNHKFLTKRGWIEAENLLETDELLKFQINT